MGIKLVTTTTFSPPHFSWVKPLDVIANGSHSLWMNTPVIQQWYQLWTNVEWVGGTKLLYHIYESTL